MTAHSELLPRYKQLRQAGLELNNRIVETVSKSVLDEGGKKLGILEGKTLVLDTEDEIAVLMDYCFHNVRRHGRTVIEEYIQSFPPPVTSDTWVVLQALPQSRFSLFAVESSERGVGVHVRDLLRDETTFLVDVGLSQSVSPGVVLATRITAPEGIAMTTGAGLPLGMLSSADRVRLLEKMHETFPGMDFQNMSPEEASEFAATIIRAALKRGAAERIAYVEPGSRSLPRGREQAALPPVQHLGRNDPCPCGSGKKFKRCCGARR